MFKCCLAGLGPDGLDLTYTSMGACQLLPGLSLVRSDSQALTLESAFKMLAVTLSVLALDVLSLAWS